MEGWSCFPGGAPPEPVLAGWRMLLGLPPTALRNLWSLLGPALEDPSRPELRQLVEGYAQRYDASAASVLGAVRACDFLLRQAASLNLDEAALRGDLERLSGGHPSGLELLLPRYREVRDQLRARLLENTLADHGNVLVAFDWRLDRVSLSNHGQLEDVPVVFLNLKYRAGNEQKQLSLQLPPSAIATLKQFWNQFSLDE
jgi:hypothetical protein